LEKDKEFNSVIKKDPRRDQTLNHVNSLRSYGSIQGLLNIMTPSCDMDTVKKQNDILP
jgi:hypothetical protein